MKTKLLILSLFILALISADLPPAHVRGQIYPDACKRDGFVNMPSQNFNGQILDAYVNGVVVASATIGGRVLYIEGVKPTKKVGRNYFEMTIDADGLAIFVLRGHENYPWGGRTIHPGDELTLNLCGAMPIVKAKKHK